MVTVVDFEKLEQDLWWHQKSFEEMFIINTTPFFVSILVLFTYLIKLNVSQLLDFVK